MGYDNSVERDEASVEKTQEAEKNRGVDIFFGRRFTYWSESVHSQSPRLHIPGRFYPGTRTVTGVFFPEDLVVWSNQTPAAHSIINAVGRDWRESTARFNILSRGLFNAPDINIQFLEGQDPAVLVAFILRARPNEASPLTIERHTEFPTSLLGIPYYGTISSYQEARRIVRSSLIQNSSPS
jgi:hypothetical protein